MRGTVEWKEGEKRRETQYLPNHSLQNERIGTPRWSQYILSDCKQLISYLAWVVVLALEQKGLSVTVMVTEVLY